jgi:protein arginine N-methyltransferase 3
LISADDLPIWLDDAYLKPVDYESWLSYDFDQLSLGQEPVEDERSQMLNTIKELTDKLEQAAQDIETMKESFKHLLAKESSKAEAVQESDKEVARKRKVLNGVASVPLEKDNDYFEAYSSYGIHHAMLSDRVRTESYRDAILKNSDIIKSKKVIDLGCGTSILSMFASQAGAETVYAIDQSEIIYQAMEIAQTNNFKNIKFIKGRLEDVELPVDKVDVLISEFMGYFLFFEGMLDSVIYARDNYLKEGGFILPNRCTISLVGYGSDERYQEFISFFNNVYGFNMKCMVKDILTEGHVEKCDSENVITKPNIISELDIMTCDMNYSNFTYDFHLEVIKNKKLTSFVGYFDTFFDLPQQPVKFSTSPYDTPTHWQQVVFYLDEPVDVKMGEIISGKIICQRDRKDLRSLKVEIQAFNKTFKYDLN